MGLFDLLFPDSSKKIYRDDFRAALRMISELSDSERAYVEESFNKELKDGLSKFELKTRCTHLMHKSGDNLESSEIKKIKEKLLKYFENDD